MGAQVGVIVMAHQRRMKQALALGDQLDAAVCMDNNAPSFASERINGDMAWRFLNESDSEWGIVVQDDAIPVDNFREFAGFALADVPEDFGAVSFYVGTGRPYASVVKTAVDMANEVDASWLAGRGLYWGVAVAIRTAMIEPMLAGIVSNESQYDQRIGQYMKDSGYRVGYTWPSLVDHADEDTLIHGRNPGMARRAHRLGPRERYTGPVVEIGAP